MKGLKKFIACMCAVVLIVSGIFYSPSNDVKAQTYDQLTYETLGSGISYSYISNTLAGLNKPEVLDNGTTMQFAFSADNTMSATKVVINGVTTVAGTGAFTYLAAGLVKLNPTMFSDNAYTHISITSTTGTAELVIKRGTPTSGGEIIATTAFAEQDTTTASGGVETITATGSEIITTKVSVTTTVNASDASSLPKRVEGVVAETKVGEDAIDNSVMIAWASSTDATNVAGYDPTVMSYNIYIYKDNQMLTQIVNATNGGVIGGLSAGNYQAAVAAVNAKGEGTLSERKTFTVTGVTLNYTYPVECSGPKSPIGLSIITADPKVQPSVGNEANAIEVAWAASSTADSPSYDTTVAGYNIYLFNAITGKPYRRVYVDGISTSYTAIKSVSAGTYLVYLSAVNAAGEESALSAPSISLASSVTVKGDVLDNAQDFGYPNQPSLPVGLEIITQGIQYGFTIAWATDANLTGIKLNLYVNGVCIKSGINNGMDSSYYENRVSAGTYTVEVKAQYTSNNVESFPLTKTGVIIAADPGLTTYAPASLADTSYTEYEEITTTVPEVTTTVFPAETTAVPGKDPTVEPTDKPGETTASGNNPTVAPTDNMGETTVQPATKPSDTTVVPAKRLDETTVAVKVAKVKIKKATKKKSIKKAKIYIKKVYGAKKYQVQISKTKKFNKKNILVKKTVKKANFIIKSNKIKYRKKLFVRVRACKVVNGKTYYGAWSTLKKIKNI